MTYRESIELARKCAKCKYATLKVLTVVEEGEYEPEFGRTECCSRTTRRECRICMPASLMCAEIEVCPATYLSEESLERLVEEYDNE